MEPGRNNIVKCKCDIKQNCYQANEGIDIQKAETAIEFYRILFINTFRKGFGKYVKVPGLQWQKHQAKESVDVDSHEPGIKSACLITTESLQGKTEAADGGNHVNHGPNNRRNKNEPDPCKKPDDIFPAFVI